MRDSAKAMVQPMTVADTMRAKLSAALTPEVIEIIDDSHRHHGHAGWREGGETHFNVTLVSAKFVGLSRVDRQRLVYQILAEEMAGPVHALQLTTRAPGDA